MKTADIEQLLPAGQFIYSLKYGFGKVEPEDENNLENVNVDFELYGPKKFYPVDGAFPMLTLLAERPKPLYKKLRTATPKKKRDLKKLKCLDCQRVSFIEKSLPDWEPCKCGGTKVFASGEIIAVAPLDESAPTDALPHCAGEIRGAESEPVQQHIRYCPHWVKVRIDPKGFVIGCASCEAVKMSWSAEEDCWNKPLIVPEKVIPPPEVQPQPKIFDKSIEQEVADVIEKRELERRRKVKAPEPFNAHTYILEMKAGIDSSWPEFAEAGLTPEEWDVWKELRFTTRTPQACLEVAAKFQRPLREIDILYRLALDKLEKQYIWCIENEYGRFKGFAKKLGYVKQLDNDQLLIQQELQKSALDLPELSGLTEDERTAMLAYIETGSTRKAAEQTGFGKSDISRFWVRGIEKVKQAQVTRRRMKFPPSKALQALAEQVWDEGGEALWTDETAQYEIRMCLRGGGWDDGNSGDNPFNSGPGRMPAFGGATIKNMNPRM